MISPQLILDVNAELFVDNFAGGGGASTGIERALGRHVDHAVNHDAHALGMHRINHPQTVHHCEDVFDVDPTELTEGRPVGGGWFSPDCKHFSKAKGGKPLSRKIRGLCHPALGEDPHAGHLHGERGGNPDVGTAAGQWQARPEAQGADLEGVPRGLGRRGCPRPS